MLEVRLLGQFQVQLHGKVVDVPSRPAQSLLAYLLLTPGTAHRREKLAGLFWPDSAEGNARSNLRHALWRVRKALGRAEAYVVSDDLTIALDKEADVWVDTAVLDCKQPEAPSLDQLREAAAVYEGELLPGFYDEWVTLERERLQAVFEQKMGLMLRRLVDAAQWSDVLAWGEHWISFGRVPERAYRALMVAHSEMGDLASMTAVYQRCVDALRRELDVEPSPQTQELFEQLASSEPRLGQETWRTSIEEEPVPGDPPFKGLEFFDVGDADLFFGRERLTTRLLNHLHLQPNRDDRWANGRFLAVIGASGSGKSSIVRAGLVSALRRGDAPGDGVLPAGFEDWRVHVLTPTARPLEALAVSLTREKSSMAATTALLDDLARDPRSLHLYLLKNLSHVLLVVDQFEELFTLCRSEAEREMFIDNLMNAACSRGDGDREGDCGGNECVSLVLALRADFYAHCGQYSELREVLARHQLFVGPMDAGELRRAIEEPARRGGWAFEPGLVDLFLQEVGDEPGRLPLLSHALLETWHRRRGRTMTLSGFYESGGVRGAIAQTAERVLGEMDEGQQAVARDVFLRLTELGEGTQDTRRRAARDELVSGSNEGEAVDAVLQRLVETRLVTAGQGTVEVAHEALIREWPTLRGWLDEDRASLHLHRHLAEAAEAWVRLDRDPGELYRGARLAQASEYAEEHAGRLNALEQEFLAASQERARRREEEREAQHRRELEAARKLAEEQVRAAAAEKERAQVQARASRRLRWLAAALGLLLLFVFGAAFLAYQQSERAEEQARLAAQQTDRAEAETRRAEGQARIASARELAAASGIQLDVDPERSILLALAAVDTTYAVDELVLPEAANALHRAIPASRIQRTIDTDSGQVWGLDYSPDGRRLATAGDDGTVRVWDARTGEELLTLTGHTFPPNAVAFSPDGTTVVSGGLDHTTRVWDATTGAELMTLGEHGRNVLDVTVSPDGHYLATASMDNTARIWDAASGETLHILDGHDWWVFGVSYSLDGRYLATASYDGTARVWDATTGQELLTLAGHDIYVSDVEFSPDGTRIATASYDSNAMIWDVSDALAAEPDEGEALSASRTISEPLFILSGHTNELTRLSFSPDGKYLATASADRQVIVWDVLSGKEVLRLAGHTGWVGNVAFSPDGKHLATSSTDETVKVWDWTSPSRELLTIAGHRAKINGMALSPDGRRVATTGLDEVTKVWDLGTGEELLTIPDAGTAPRIWAYPIEFSPDGARLTTVAADGAPRMWDADTGEELVSFSGHEGAVWYVDLSPDGTRLVTAGEDGTARIWDARTGEQIAVTIGPTSTLFYAGFSPDGRLVATASQDRTARLWDADTGQALFTFEHDDEVYKAVFDSEGARLVTVPMGFDWAPKVWDVATGNVLLTLSGHEDAVWEAAFSPDGTRLATSGKDATVRIWDAATGETLWVLAGHTSSVFRVAFSPDGTRLASAGFDGETRVWDVASGEELLVLGGHDGAVNSVAFDAGGTHLITVGDDGTVRVHVLPIEQVVALARERLTRTWTREECQQFLHTERCPGGP